MVKIGERVGAILSADKNECRYLGFGVYEGDFIPKEAVGFIAEAEKKQGMTNPRIRLDNGKVVYGCECWWGSEERIKNELKKYPNVKLIDIEEERKEI
jgi:hypothetical protein